MRKIEQDQGASSKLDRATHEQSPQAVSAVPVGIPSAHTLFIDADEYRRRREAEMHSALASREVFGSWAALAQSLLHGVVTWERDAGCQWGSFHHQCAIAAAGLKEELAAQGNAARSDETAQQARPEGQEPDPEGDAP